MLTLSYSFLRILVKASEEADVRAFFIKSEKPIMSNRILCLSYAVKNDECLKLKFARMDRKYVLRIESSIYLPQTLYQTNFILLMHFSQNRYFLMQDIQKWTNNTSNLRSFQYIVVSKIFLDFNPHRVCKVCKICINILYTRE